MILLLIPWGVWFEEIEEACGKERDENVLGLLEKGAKASRAFWIQEGWGTATDHCCWRARLYTDIAR
jgi:hypothetical protein